MPNHQSSCFMTILKTGLASLAKTCSTLLVWNDIAAWDSDDESLWQGKLQSIFSYPWGWIVHFCFEWRVVNFIGWILTHWIVPSNLHGVMMHCDIWSCILVIIVRQSSHAMPSQMATFMGPSWGPPGSCRPQMDPMFAPWTLLSGMQNTQHIFF